MALSYVCVCEIYFTMHCNEHECPKFWSVCASKVCFCVLCVCRPLCSSPYSFVFSGYDEILWLFLNSNHLIMSFTGVVKATEWPLKPTYAANFRMSHAVQFKLNNELQRCCEGNPKFLPHYYSISTVYFTLLEYSAMKTEQHLQNWSLNPYPLHLHVLIMQILIQTQVFPGTQLQIQAFKLLFCCPPAL